MKTNIEDIDAIFEVMGKAKRDKLTEQVIQGTNDAIEYNSPHLGWINPKKGVQLSEAEYKEMIGKSKSSSLANHSQYYNKKETIKNKTIGRPAVSKQKIKFFDEFNDFIKEYKVAIVGVLAVASIVISIAAPNLKANQQISDLSDSLSDNLSNMNYGQLQDNIFSKIKLTVEPSKFINDLGLTPNSNIRLYILSTVIQASDFENILKELGYRSLDDYVKKLGYEHTVHLRASEQYFIDYGKKLNEIIIYLNKNPEELNEHLNKYPELSLIYGDSYLINNQAYTVSVEKGRPH